MGIVWNHLRYKLPPQSWSKKFRIPLNPSQLFTNDYGETRNSKFSSNQSCRIFRDKPFSFGRCSPEWWFKSHGLISERNIKLKATPKQIIKNQKYSGFIPRTQKWKHFFPGQWKLPIVQKKINLQCCVHVPLLSLFNRLPIETLNVWPPKTSILTWYTDQQPIYHPCMVYYGIFTYIWLIFYGFHVGI